jgi:hypothetical protein
MAIAAIFSPPGARRSLRGGDAAIERDQQQHLADFLRRAAVLQRALEMHAQLSPPVGGGHHRDHGEAFDAERQAGAAPDVAIGIGVDDVLQRLAELAERLHALLDGFVAEQLFAELQAFLGQLTGIHMASPFFRRQLYDGRHCRA